MENVNSGRKLFCGSLSVIVAILVLGLVTIYCCNSYWSHKAEEVVVTGVASLVEKHGEEAAVHLEPAPKWGEDLPGRMENALSESVQFKTNFYREKRQQHDYIDGRVGRVFKSSAIEMGDIPEEAMKQADRKVILSIGESSGGMQSASARKKAMVMVEDGESSELAVSDEINCYAYAVRLEQSVPLSVLLIKDGINLEYTALATATVRQDHWK